ncbi:MAG: polysaccharide biosynthesis/export family protein [Planctomycetaceae bacterium]|jgi:polysaccharide export outer membrane protein|nr:polysaccharide biosynthesis/export family protein [Planctomycetaceae bacterium]
MINTADILTLIITKTVILSAAALLIWGLLALFRCRSLKIQRTAWLCVLLLGIFGAGVPVPIHVVQEKVAQEKYAAVHVPKAAAETVTDTDISAAIPAIVSPLSVNETSLPSVPSSVLPEQILTGIWLGGVLCLLLWQLTCHCLLLWKLRKAVPAAGNQAAEWQRHLMPSEKLPLLLTEHLGPGLVWCPHGSAVLVPHTFWDETTPETREAVLRHELAHFRNGDIRRSFLARMLVFVHWFNPLAWFSLKKLDEASESLCDLEAFGSLSGGTLRFAESMLALYETSPSVFVHRYAFGGGSLTHRVQSLQFHLTNSKESIMKRMFVSLAVLAVLAAGILNVRLAAQQQPPLAASVPKTEDKDKTKPQGGISPRTEYRIESPDVLTVDAHHLVPKVPYRLKTFDVINIAIGGCREESPSSVEPGGIVQLGFDLGSVKLGGLTLPEAEEAVKQHLKGGNIPKDSTIPSQLRENPRVCLKLVRMTDMEQIAGERRVAPDGCLTLGSYGRVYVSGLTVAECTKAIEEQLAKKLENPEVTVEVTAMNSKKYYIVFYNPNGNEQIQVLPWSGNDDVMGTVSRMRDCLGISGFHIEHIRPAPDGGQPVKREIQWSNVLVSRSGFGDNIRLLPDDRLILTPGKQ